MLGLRLALSQAHVTSRARQQQFMFLDEPFKMMDSTRVVGALESLGKLSEELRHHVWMFFQERYGSQATEASWNTQMAFRGHMVALCDEKTSSDGEAL